MWPRLILAAALAAHILHAENRLRLALDRLAQEASAFQQIAPDLLARETLRQRALKPAQKHFSLHLGQLPAREPEWQAREIISEYGFASLSDNPAALREFRKPVAVDGRPVPGSANAAARLADSIHSADEGARRRLLEGFEKLGLVGTVTDFGQLLLLFTRTGQERYEFQPVGARMLGAEPVLAIAYKQNDGPAALTIWEGNKRVSGRIRGELWFRESDLLPLRITLYSVRGELQNSVREEAQVDYTPTTLGCLVPVAVLHLEYRAQGLVAENRFTFGSFQKFGFASQ